MKYSEVKDSVISNFGILSNETTIVSMSITALIARRRSTQQTHIVVELESVVYDIGNMEHKIEEEFNSYLGNVTADLFQLVSINQIEVRDQEFIERNEPAKPSFINGLLSNQKRKSYEHQIIIMTFTCSPFAHRSLTSLTVSSFFR